MLGMGLGGRCFIFSDPVPVIHESCYLSTRSKVESQPRVPAPASVHWASKVPLQTWRPLLRYRVVASGLHAHFYDQGHILGIPG